MKKVYWRPTKIPRVILLVISILAIASMLSVELFKTESKKKYHEEKFKAARAMKRGLEVLKQYRLKHIGPIDTEVDPANSGMIGLPESPITSDFGFLPAKQTTINPNWAAVMVQMLKQADVKEGDIVAMGFSGSFPAINLASLVAAEQLKCKVIAITGVAASTWGANIPEFTWLDMENILYKKGVISNRSVAASLGGDEYRSVIGSKKGRRLLQAAIQRNGVRFLDFKGTKESIDERMAIYQELAEGKQIAAYVNVGGSRISAGTRAGKRLYNAGLNRRPPPGALNVDSVMTRLAEEDIPLIHMILIDKLADRYGLPKSPTTVPKIGDGHIYERKEYNRYLAAANFLILLFLLYIFLRSDIGYRIFGSSRIAQAPKHPEPMV
jgi:poly-gamma-glutamate system protein